MNARSSLIRIAIAASIATSSGEVFASVDPDVSTQSPSRLTQDYSAPFRPQTFALQGELFELQQRRVYQQRVAERFSQVAAALISKLNNREIKLAPGWLSEIDRLVREAEVSFSKIEIKESYSRNDPPLSYIVAIINSLNQAYPTSNSFQSIIDTELWNLRTNRNDDVSAEVSNLVASLDDKSGSPQQPAVSSISQTLNAVLPPEGQRITGEELLRRSSQILPTLKYLSGDRLERTASDYNTIQSSKRNEIIASIDAIKSQIKSGIETIAENEARVIQKLDETSASRNRVDSALIYVAIGALVVVFFLGAMVIFSKSRNTRLVVQERTLVELFGTATLFAAILLLAASSRIASETVGTLLGAMAGYLLGSRGSRPSSRQPRKPIRSSNAIGSVREQSQSK